MDFNGNTNTYGNEACQWNLTHVKLINMRRTSSWDNLPVSQDKMN